MVLAHEEVGLARRPGRRHFPRRVGDKRLPRAIGILDVELAHERRRRTVEVAAGAMGAVTDEQSIAEVAGIPAIGHLRGEAGGARLLREQVRDVVAAGMDTLRVVGPAGGKPGIAHWLAIDPPLDEPQGGAMEDAALHRLGETDNLPISPCRWQMERGRIGVDGRVVGGRNPLPLPVVRLELADQERCRGSEPGRHPSLIPHPHRPVDALAGHKRLAAPHDRERLGRCHDAGIPPVGLPRLE